MDSKDSSEELSIDAAPRFLKERDIFIFNARPLESIPFIRVDSESKINEMILYIKTSLFSGKEVLVFKDVKYLNSVKESDLKGKSFSIDDPNIIYLSLGTKSRMFTHFHDEKASFDSLRNAIKELLLS